jgi:hypothetical protein
MELDEMIEGLRAAVQASLAVEHDVVEAGGATH